MLAAKANPTAVRDGIQSVLASQASLGTALGAALDPEKVADVVLDAIRERRFYILPHPEEAIDMAEQQLRWMRTNEPLVPGPGVARTAD